MYVCMYVSNCDDRELFRLVNRMSSVRSENNFPDRETLASEFSEYFDSKMRQIRVALDEFDCKPMSAEFQRYLFE